VSRGGSEIELVLGTAQFQPGYGQGPRSELSEGRGAAALLDAAGDVGVAALDTAPAYGDAEAVIGAAEWALPVHTKIDPKLEPSASLTRSLERMGRTRVDVLYVHSSTEVLLKESPVLDAAAALVGERVGKLGVSVYEVEEFRAAVADPRITVVQVPLNLFDRRLPQALLDEADLAGTDVYVRSVLLQGVLVADPNSLLGSTVALRSYVVAFDEKARKIGRSRAELAFGWVRSTPGIKGAVFGADSVGQLNEIAELFRGPALDEEVLAELASLPTPPWELCDPRRWSTGQSR